MQKGYQISFFTEQSRRKDGRPMGNWILETAKSLRGQPFSRLRKAMAGTDGLKARLSLSPASRASKSAWPLQKRTRNA
jgi:hypothetical protein